MTIDKETNREEKGPLLLGGVGEFASVESAVQVIAGLFGFGFLIWGSQQASMGGSQIVGMGSALFGTILLVFAAQY